jgi:hypothetical protein
MPSTMWSPQLLNDAGVTDDINLQFEYPLPQVR